MEEKKKMPHGLRFGEGQKINKAGRPPNLDKELAKLTPGQFRESARIIGAMTVAEVRKYVKKRAATIWDRVVAKIYLRALESGDVKDLKVIIEHTLGKPPQQTDITSGGEKIKNITGFTINEISSVATEN